MSNDRCIVVQESEKHPDGLIRVPKCDKCITMDECHDWCILVDAYIEDYEIIHKDCPLPLYDRMRWHMPDEVPPDGKIVRLKLKIKYIISDKYIGFYQSLPDEWRGCGYRSADKIIEKSQIVSWRHL
jgi:hypothetical protein